MYWPLPTPRRKKPFVIWKDRIRVRNWAEFKWKHRSTKPNQKNPFKVRVWKK